jgi:hypothetical protein
VIPYGNTEVLRSSVTTVLDRKKRPRKAHAEYLILLFSLPRWPELAGLLLGA